MLKKIIEKQAADNFFPINVTSFLLELPYCNTDYFELFLNEFFLTNHQELKVIVLDNGAFHKAKRLKIQKTLFLFSYHYLVRN
jgi:hypothetical protein